MPLLVRPAVVLDHTPAIPCELVVQELVSQEELNTKQGEVEELTCEEKDDMSEHIECNLQKT